MKLYCKSYWVYTVKDLIEYLFSLYCCFFTCLRLANPKVQLGVLMILTLNGLFQKKNLSFLLYPWKFHTNNPPTLPPLFVFFHYRVFTVISDSNHPFDTFDNHSLTNTFIAVENTYLNGVFLKSKISIFL